jgi:enoyl-CoA hydratase/carnithine racemase
MPVDVAREGAVAVVTIDRPDALNALDVETLTALRDQLAELAGDDGARAVVLTGAGGRAFAAGADIKYMSDIDGAPARAWGALGHDAGRLLETMPKPTLAAIDGFALGGGFELALACDLRIGSPRAKLGLPETNLGIVPGWGGTQRLARLAGAAVAKELILTGRTVGADEALRLGLVHEVVDSPLERACELAAQFAAKSRTALAAAKQLVNLALGVDHPGNLEAEADVFAGLLGSADALEGLSAFVEKRRPRFGE